jgi:hypothetical protein
MSAPTDRSNDPNSVSYYAPRGARPTRLPPVEPMPALMPEVPPPSESRTSLPRRRCRCAIDRGSPS